MKKTILLLFCLFGSLSFYGQSVDVQFVESPLTDCSADQFCGTIQIQGNAGADFVGISSIRFNYDAAVLGFNGDEMNGVTQGMYIAENFDSTTTDPGCTSTPPFTEHAFDGTNPGDFLLTFILLSPTIIGAPSSCPEIGNGWVDVATICFDILDPSGNPNINFVGVQNATPVSTNETNFNSDTNDPADKYDNGTFTGFAVPLSTVCEGCTNAAACNYDPMATVDDGSCNLPDCLGNCTGTNTGPAIAGTACNDGDACTTGDVYDASCNCAGTFADADVDGVCDADDQCPGTNDALIGTACNDGDACTTGDVYDNSCNCAGTFADADADGVCDADDICPGGDDTADADMDGVPDFCDNCPTGDADNDGVCDGVDVCPGFNDNLIGQPCDDSNACTINDIYDGSCNCVGTFQDSDNDGVCDVNDQCPGTNDALIGTACNDGDDCTINDVYNSSCNCLGTFADADGDGVCNANDQCPGTDDALIGTACDDGDVCTTGDVYDSSCNCAGTFADADGDGTCDANDLCPNSQEPGSSCNDNDICTINDVIQSDCSCMGTFQDSDMDGICDALDGCVGGNPGDACNDNDACTVNDEIQADCSCAGTFADADGDGVCNNDDVCPSLDDALIGTACDDGNACTVLDTYDNSCNCIGVFADADGDGVCDADDACPSFNDALIGTACNDGNVCTINDTFTSTCGCVGTFVDSDGDGTCDANDLCDGGLEPGTACDDGNPLTTNDAIDGGCNCVGQPASNSCTLEIPLNAGWNLISSYCQPSNLDMEAVFADVVGNTVQVKNLTATYVPAFGFNNIGNWDMTSGYQVKMVADDTLVINGTLVDPLATPINLNAGWNLISYLLTTPSDPFNIYVDINGNIIQMKNLTGTYIPSFNFNDMGNVLPTQGYQVKMDVDDILIYDPANQ